jgi:hypothetical protein
MLRQELRDNKFNLLLLNVKIEKSLVVHYSGHQRSLPFLFRFLRNIPANNLLLT